MVRARDPLWHDRDHGIEPAQPTGEHVHVPPPSYYPILIAAGMTVNEMKVDKIEINPVVDNAVFTIK